MADYYMNTDGGARGNPGPAGGGVVITDSDHQLVTEFSKEFGVATNNQAEYWALVFGLEKLKSLDLGAADIEVRMDSELIVKQLKGLYKVKNQGLKPLFDRANKLIDELPAKIRFVHVPRRHNKRADELANEAMDKLQASKS